MGSGSSALNYPYGGTALAGSAAPGPTSAICVTPPEPAAWIGALTPNVREVVTREGGLRRCWRGDDTFLAPATARPRAPLWAWRTVPVSGGREVAPAPVRRGFPSRSPGPSRGPPDSR